MKFKTKEDNHKILLTHKVRFIGFTFAPHPKKYNHFVEATLYQILGKTRSYVFCFSEGEGIGDVDLTRKELGRVLEGKEIIPFAGRFLVGPPLYEVKGIAEAGLSGEWYWIGDRK